MSEDKSHTTDQGFYVDRTKSRIPICNKGDWLRIAIPIHNSYNTYLYGYTEIFLATIWDYGYNLPSSIRFGIYSPGQSAYRLIKILHAQNVTGLTGSLSDLCISDIRLVKYNHAATDPSFAVDVKTNVAYSTGSYMNIAIVNYTATAGYDGSQHLSLSVFPSRLKCATEWGETLGIYNSVVSGDVLASAPVSIT